MTIAQQIKWDFKTNGELMIRDKNGKEIYQEFSSGAWGKYEYDSKGNGIYYENSDGFWVKHKWDSQGKLNYIENSGGYWEKREWNSYGNLIYFENSDGKIEDKRPKPCENKIVEIDGEKFKLVKV